MADKPDIVSEPVEVSNADVGAEYFFTRNVGVGAGIVYTKLQVEETEDPRLRITYRYSGLLLYGVFAVF